MLEIVGVVGILDRTPLVLPRHCSQSPVIIGMNENR